MKRRGKGEPVGRAEIYHQAARAAHLLHTSIVDLLNQPVPEFFRIIEAAHKVNEELQPKV